VEAHRAAGSACPAVARPIAARHSEPGHDSAGRGRGLKTEHGKARDGAQEPAGTRQRPIASPGSTPSRRVVLLVEAEQRAELPARDPRAGPRPGQLRPDVRRPLNA